MRYAAVFTVCDAVVIVYMGGLKGAGDTRFIMLVMGTASIASIVIPMLVLSWLGITNIHWPWLFLLVYVVVLAVIFTARFIRGPWRRIDLIGRGDRSEMG